MTYYALSWGSSMVLYLDGSVFASRSTAIVPTLMTRSVHRLGCHYDGRLALDGKIAAAQIWGRALSAADVSQLYTYNLNDGVSCAATAAPTLLPTPPPTPAPASMPEDCVDCSRRQVRQLLFGHLILNCCSDGPNSVEFDD